MPNMSDKNFPHAHGSGRVVAAFQLSHPGSTQWIEGPPYAPGARDMLCLPPVLNDPTLATTYPYPDTGPAFGTGQAKLFRQPHNATSVGVFVQGSGTRRLPYQEAILPAVPDSVSIPLNRQIPGTGVYPFQTVDQTVLGRTHAQVVCSAVGGDGSCPGYPPELTGAGLNAYYEIGLNWELPTYRFVQDGVGGITANFANQKIASVQRAIERTYWATASLATSALSEFHPQVDYGAPVATLNFLEGPGDGNLSTLESTQAQPVELRGMAAPYGVIPFDGGGSQSVVQPAFSPTYPGVDDDFVSRPYCFQTQVSALVTRWRTVQTLASFTFEFSLAPIVRVWCLLAAPAVSPGQDSPTVAPRPIPRGGIGAYRYNDAASPDDISMIPGVNVQVIQKNTSASDNTDLPVYDLGTDWGILGTEDIRTPRKFRSPVSDVLPGIKKDDE